MGEKKRCCRRNRKKLPKDGPHRRRVKYKKRSGGRLEVNRGVTRRILRSNVVW